MIDFLDLRTLSLVLGLNSVAMAGIMLYISLTRLTYQGFHLWTLSFVFGGLGMILTSLRHIAPDWVSILAANLCVLAFTALLVVGLAKFLSAPYRLWLVIIVSAMAMAGLAYFTYWQPIVSMRVVVMSLATGLLLAHSLFLVLRNAKQRLGFNNYLLKSVLAFLSLWMLIRAIMTHLLESHLTDFLSASILQGLTFVFFTLGSLLIMGGLIILNAQRMESELASADQEIQDMSRLIPICANCKKIRDDQGYWEAVESYIQRMTDNDLTHGICPECAEKLYPGIYKKPRD